MKNIISKILVLLFIVALLQSALTPFLNTFNTPIEIKELNEYLKDNVDIIYFGDSTLLHSAENDSDKRSIAMMLHDRVPRLKIKGMFHGAFNADIYLPFCSYITKQHSRPKTVIIPINMRSFSPEWDMRPQYQFEELKVFLGENNFLKNFYKPLSIFKYNPYRVTQRQFENSLIFNGDEPIGRVKDFNWTIHKYYKRNLEEFIKKIFLYFYMGSLKEEHRKIQSLVGIARTTKQSGIKVIFYITPIDYETGEKYLPKQFLERLGHNTNVIISSLLKEGVDVLDLSKDLKTELFDYTLPWINEHLNERGRNYVADKIADKIKTITNFMSAP